MRLLETFQFVLEVMDCDPVFPPSKQPRASAEGSLLPGGEAWKSIVRVRMLHGVARSRAVARLAMTADSTAINQEDLSAT
jgi:hypothetical protein